MFTFLILFLCRFNKFTWCGIATLKLLIWISRRLIGCLIVRLSDNMFLRRFPLSPITTLYIFFYLFVSQSQSPLFRFSSLFPQFLLWKFLTTKNVDRQHDNDLVTAFYYFAECTRALSPSKINDQLLMCYVIMAVRKVSEKRLILFPSVVANSY